jgi:hypothetical protein
MTKQAIIKKIIEKLNKLPEDKAIEFSLLFDAFLEKQESEYFTKNILKIASESHAFAFLVDDDDELYQLSDIKEVYK